MGLAKSRLASPGDQGQVVPVLVGQKPITSSVGPQAAPSTAAQRVPTFLDKNNPVATRDRGIQYYI